MRDHMRARAGTVAVLVMVGATLAACSSGGSTGGNGATGATAPSTSTTGARASTTAPRASTTAPTSTASTTTGTPATSAPASALEEAANLEGASLATYQAVVARLGTITPFVNVASSESQHLAAVTALADRYGVTVPTGPFSAPPVPATRTAACRLGVTTEEHVVSTYDTLLPQVAAYPDVARVFTTLRNAAQDSHLPAFRHCA